MAVDQRELLDEAKALGDEMVTLRRDIHRQPELGLHNPMTQERIIAELEPLGYEITTGTDITSVVATLQGAEPGPTIVLRADTDALPMTEETEWEHRSEIPDRAHMCGHDAHVAMLVGAARMLRNHQRDLRGTVRLAFQPGEEGAGGMPVMLREGLLETGLSQLPDAAFAIHVTPNIPVGIVGAKAGSLMASTDDFKVTIRGSGGHASTPHFANDPIPVAAEMVTALQTLVTRRVNAFDPAVVTVAHIAAGSTSNVIPETVWFEGTIRTVSEQTRALVREGFERVVRGVAAAHDCTADIDLRAGYPVTINNSSVVDFCAQLANSVGGDHTWFELPSPVMGAEDVSYLFQQVPGAMVFLGVCPSDIGNSLLAPSCHSNLMRLNEDALPLGAVLHTAFVLSWR